MTKLLFKESQVRMQVRRLSDCWIAITLMVMLIVCCQSCGNSNVPLTQPPPDAFRVSTPRPPLSASPTPVLLPTLSLGALTAQFFEVPWANKPPASLLALTAEVLGIPLGVATPRPSPTWVLLENTSDTSE